MARVTGPALFASCVATCIDWEVKHTALAGRPMNGSQGKLIVRRNQPVADGVKDGHSKTEPRSMP